jgi:hypothetical protein
MRSLAATPAFTDANADACAALLRAVKPSATILVALRLRQPCALLLGGVADAIERGGPLISGQGAGAG